MGSYLIINRQDGPWPYVFAIVAHVVVFGLLMIARADRGVAVPAGGAGPGGVTMFRMLAPPEGSTPMYMSMAEREVLPREGQDGIADGEMVAGGRLDMPADTEKGGISDAELAEIMAAERRALQAEFDQLTETAMASPLPKAPVPRPSAGRDGGGKRSPEGAVRELNLEGFPQAVVDDIMERYELKIVTRRIEAGRRGQSFLSSASRGESERYFGGMTVPTGVYEVFQLSRESVAIMSRLEEEALIARGMEPLRTRVIRIVFGIVESETGGYELGVKSLDAEPVLP